MRGLYAVTPELADTRLLADQVSAAIAGGARIVQYRNKAASPALKLEQARALKALCASRGATLIVNDDVDLALAVDADGVHLGAEDGSALQARATLGPAKVIGISCYDSLERALAAQTSGADYVAFGSFFASQVKPDAVHAPLELLARAKREIEMPVAAIGGITLANAPRLIAAGADALAVISALFGAQDITAAARAFTALFESQA